MKDYREEFFKKVLLGSSVDLNNSDTIIKTNFLTVICAPYIHLVKKEKKN